MELSQKSDKIYISNVMQQRIRYFWRHTGLCCWEIFDKLDPRPDGLTEHIIQGWVGARTRWANPAHWDAVISQWEAIYNDIKAKGDRPKNKIKPAFKQKPGYWVDYFDQERLAFTPDMHTQMNAELKRTQAHVRVDIVQARGVPEGLTEYIFGELRKNNLESVRADYWAFIVETMGNLPDCKAPYKIPRCRKIVKAVEIID